MSLSLRFLLLLGSAATLFYFTRSIRKSRLKINHAIFWIVFGLMLMVLAVIPEGIYWLSWLLGFQSPVNLVYVAVIFLLILKLFTTTVKLSRLSEQVAALTQEVALAKLDADQKAKDTNKELSEQVHG